MAKAHVDPTELRRFGKDLQRFNEELETMLRSLHSRMVALERTWQDQEQRKFMGEFEQTMKTLGRFLETSNQHSSFLLKKARHIEEYLRQQ